jgi:hypothetical protein
LFKLNRHPEVYNQLKKTKKQANQILRALNAIQTSKVQIENTEIDVLHICLSSFNIKYENL